MSDKSKDGGFETMSWKAGGHAKPDPHGAPGAKRDETFRALYGHQKKAPAQETFVASFVSEEKARKLARSQQEPPPEAKGEGRLEEIEQQAYDAGFAKGRAAGLEEGRLQAREMVDRLQAILTDAEAAWHTLIATHEKQMIELIGRVAEKVVYTHVDLDQRVVRQAIVEALRIVPEPVNVEISVHPKDYEYIETIKEDFFSQVKALKDVTVIPDPAVNRGGCHLKTRFGEVDATLENRLAAVCDCLRKANGRKA